MQGEAAAVRSAGCVAGRLGVEERAFLACDEAMYKAGLKPSDINQVLLSGGACYMPMIQSGAARYFGRTPTLLDSPDRAVAVGAALYAGRS